MIRRGFSLLEALITMFLVASVFGLVILLLHDATRLVSRSNQRDTAAAAGQVGLERVCNDLWEATRVDTPAPATGSADLIFEKVDGASTTRLPTPIPTPSIPFNSADPAFHLTVHYFINNNQLVRDVGPEGGAPTLRMAVAENISGFRCTQIQQGIYYIVLSVQVGTEVYSYYSTVCVPGLQW